MPLKTPTDIIWLGGWAKGLNRDASELQIAPDESPDMLNVDLGLRGDFAPRAGYVRVDTGAPAMSDTGQTLFYYELTGGTNRVLAHSEDGTEWSGLTDFNLGLVSTFGAHSNRRNWPISIVQYEDYLFCFSLRGNTRRFDGSSWVSITDVTIDESGSAASPEAPEALAAEVHASRIFVGNIRENAGSYRSRLRWSMLPTDNSGDAGGNRWQANAFIDINEDDGEEIRALATFQSQLIIFKDHSVHLLAGSDPSNFALFKLADGVGTTSHNSVAGDESNLFWFDRDEGVFMFDGSRVIRIDHAIHDYLLAGQKRNRAWKACGFFKDNRYILSVPWGANEYNSRTFVFDTQLGAWTEYDIGFYDIARIGDDYYAVGNEDGNGIFTFEDATVTTDATVGFDWHLETAWFPHAAGQGMGTFRVRRVDMWADNDSLAADVILYIDGIESAAWSRSVTTTDFRTELPSYTGLVERFKIRAEGTTS